MKGKGMIRKKRCLKCRLAQIWNNVKDLVERRIDAIYVTDQVVAYLYKDGMEIERIIGPKRHNKYTTEGLENIADALRAGAAGTTPLKILQMLLGTECSDTSFTVIMGTAEDTTNTDPGEKQVKFTAEWAAAGAIENICQAAIAGKGYLGVSNPEYSYYNFGTAFTKPDEISLKIEWTTTLSS